MASTSIAKRRQKAADGVTKGLWTAVFGTAVATLSLPLVGFAESFALGGFLGGVALVGVGGCLVARCGFSLSSVLKRRAVGSCVAIGGLGISLLAYGCSLIYPSYGVLPWLGQLNLFGFVGAVVSVVLLIVLGVGASLESRLDAPREPR